MAVSVLRIIRWPPQSNPSYYVPDGQSTRPGRRVHRPQCPNPASIVETSRSGCAPFSDLLVIGSRILPVRNIGGAPSSWAAEAAGRLFSSCGMLRESRDA